MLFAKGAYREFTWSGAVRDRQKSRYMDLRVHNIKSLKREKKQKISCGQEERLEILLKMD